MRDLRDRSLDDTKQPILVEEIRVGLLPKSISINTAIVALLFIALMIAAEEVTVFVGTLPGALIYGLLLVSLSNLNYFSHMQHERQVYLALTLPPLLRILSLAMPVPHKAQIFWYLIVSLPLLLSVVMVIRFNGLPALNRSMSWTKWINQLIFGLCGIPLGVIAFFVLKSKPIFIDPNQLWAVMGGIALTVFSAVMEELIFRGILQKALSYPFGFLSFFFSAILYASMFLGTLSLADVLFFGLTGLLFSLWVQISESLWGVISAHAVMNTVFFLLFLLR